MEDLFKDVLGGYEDCLYFVFRVFVGLLFFQHGVKNLFGWFGGSPSELFSKFGVAGVIELVVGVLIVLGLFTRLAAVVSGLEMVVAYFMVHFPSGWIPILNGGELALLYFASFLVLIVYGSGKWSLDRLFFGKEFF